MITLYGEHVTIDEYADSSAPSLRAIGVGLGRQPRFAGQTALFYPVLAHVLTCAALASDELAVHALLHDAQESLLGDVPATWKTPDREELENLLLDRIYSSLDLVQPTEVQKAEIKEIDLLVRTAEAYVLKHFDPSAFGTEPNKDAMEITEYHLGRVPHMLVSDISSAIYQEAYEHYHELMPVPTT